MECREYKVSVIIPCFNSSRFIEDCLNSLLHQEFIDFEVICIDDGSTDDTLNLLKKYEMNWPNIRVISQIHRGLSAARNLGLGYAKGEYIFFMDSDDVIKPMGLQKLYSLSISNNLDVLMFSFENFASDKDLTPSFKKKLISVKRSNEYVNVMTGLEMMYYQLRAGEFYPMVWIQFTKRSLFDNWRCPFIEGHIFEDTPYTYQLLLNCKRVMCITDIIYRKRLHPDSICGKAESMENIISFYRNVEEVCAIGKSYNQIDGMIRYVSEEMFARAVKQLALHLTRLDKKQRDLFFDSHDYPKSLQLRAVCSLLKNEVD